MLVTCISPPQENQLPSELIFTKALTILRAARVEAWNKQNQLQGERDQFEQSCRGKLDNGGRFKLAILLEEAVLPDFDAENEPTKSVIDRLEALIEKKEGEIQEKNRKNKKNKKFFEV